MAEIVGAYIGTIVVIIVAGFFIYAGITIVPQGFHFTVVRFGKYSRSLRPGLRFIIPFIERIDKNVTMMEQVLDVPQQEVITKDNVLVEVNGVVFYRIIDAAAASYEVENLKDAINNLTLTNIRTVMGSMDFDSVLSQRDEINSSLLSVVDQATTPWGTKVTRIEIKDISPMQAMVEAMAMQAHAERERRAVILEAEGRREAAYCDAEARERAAEAEAKATELMSNAISKGDVQAVNYFVAEKYVDALKSMASARNQKVLMLPIEATSALGTVAGLAELTKEAFDRDK